MISRKATVALAFAATVSTAAADATRARAIEARVDGAGQVTIGAPPPVVPERIDSNRIDSHAAAPCSASPAITPDAARALVQRIAARENFYPDFVLAVARQESGFNSLARSPKGAFGLMQLLPETAARFGIDLCDPAGNVLGGVRFLRALREKYRNPLLILAAYNAGEGAVEKNHGLPPYPETVRFVAAVINDVYGQPTPGQLRANPWGFASAAPNASDLTDFVEAPTAGPSAPPSVPAPSLAPAPSPAQKIGWDGGFVMHFD